MKELPGEWRSARADFMETGLYGSLEPFMRGLRAGAPRDLGVTNWREAHPGQSFPDWQSQARKAALGSLAYEPGPAELQAEVLSNESRPNYKLNRIAFNTAPWSRVEGVFAWPHGKGPFPGVLVLHSWGGPMLLGKERVFPLGPKHPRLAELLDRAYGGKFVGEELVARGYAVLVIDAHHFGSRLPWGAQVLASRPEPWLPEKPDILSLSLKEFDRLDTAAKELLDLSARYVGWAGATWTGLNFWDDSRCDDYLLSRPEVDPARLGCVGQSGGGYRSHFLAALDARITASVSSCWFTTGDWTQAYKVIGPIGPAHLVPNLWRRMDLPDLALLAAPRPKLVICGSEDQLFAPEAMTEAASQLQAGYEWAGAPDHFEFFYPAKPHCFDVECQQAAWTFLARWLGGASSLS